VPKSTKHLNQGAEKRYEIDRNTKKGNEEGRVSATLLQLVNEKEYEKMLKRLIIESCSRFIHSCFRALIKSHSNDSNKIESLYIEMKEDGIKPSVVTFNTLIDAYAKNERLDDAIEMGANMERMGSCPMKSPFEPSRC
jgi:pentatricopeptide repeat protein